ncbi:MAG: DNA repair protein RadA, partial [Tidjanibacter sp.]|nr:DNA repair protein RadA [Tidjanibacter sp.]
MAKVKKAYFCKECGNEAPKWFGQCPACGAWGSCSEEVVSRSVGESSLRREGSVKPRKVAEIEEADQQRIQLCSA